jgi:DNA-binding response OmpR family regulator
MPPRHLVVVEDDPDIQQLLLRHLERIDAQVAIAPSGEAALELFARHRPDLVLLDLCLPGIDGAEVLRRMRADVRLVDVPVLVVSILERHDTIHLEAPLDTVGGWLVKPFSGSDVVREARRLLDHEPLVSA